MAVIAFTIPGTPATITAQQKGIHISHKRAIIYTKAAIKAESRRIAAGAAKYVPKAPLEGPLFFFAAVFFPLTAALVEKHADKLADLDFACWKITRPDADNTGKLLLDTFTKQGFWNDDAQVCVPVLAKAFGVVPRIEIRIGPLQAGPEGVLRALLAVWEGDSGGKRLPDLQSGTASGNA